MSVSVSVCFHMHVSRIPRPVFIQLSVSVAWVYRSVWWRCNTLCTSGFVDDVMFSNNWHYVGVTVPQQPRCNIEHGLTPRRMTSIVSYRAVAAGGGVFRYIVVLFSC